MQFALVAGLTLTTAGGVAVPSAATVSASPAAVRAGCPSSLGAGEAAGNLTVTIPRLVLFHLDSTGRIASVQTNTGRAPCAGDTLVALRGKVARPANAVERAEVLSAR